jgi:hypothetical protein
MIRKPGHSAGVCPELSIITANLTPFAREARAEPPKCCLGNSIATPK